MKYLAMYEKTNTGYSAHIPDLPGCVAAGRTLEETKQLLQEAVEMHLAGMKEDGLEIPEPCTETDYVTVVNV